jgi:hypothetical protein
MHPPQFRELAKICLQLPNVAAFWGCAAEQTARAEHAVAPISNRLEYAEGRYRQPVR